MELILTSNSRLNVGPHSLIIAKTLFSPNFPEKPEEIILTDQFYVIINTKGKVATELCQENCLHGGLKLEIKFI